MGLQETNKFPAIDRRGNTLRDFRRGPRRDDGPKQMHKAVCAECGNECEVPFEPAQDRPVYCKDCYQKRKKPRY